MPRDSWANSQLQSSPLTLTLKSISTTKPDTSNSARPLQLLGAALIPSTYLINTEHWVGPQRSGPIFFYCGNEGDIVGSPKTPLRMGNRATIRCNGGFSR
ncbi:Alpha/Beta hydrolase fold, partial [Sesbania bispinosa]